MVVESRPERLAAIGVQTAKIFSTTCTKPARPGYRPRARKTAIQLRTEFGDVALCGESKACSRGGSSCAQLLCEYL